MYMYPLRASISIQGLDRHALTVGVISGAHSQVWTLQLWHHFASYGSVYTVGKKHSGKADQSTLASGSSENT